MSISFRNTSPAGDYPEILIEKIIGKDNLPEVDSIAFSL